jgi:secreted trypsin-like serine protease
MIKMIQMIFALIVSVGALSISGCAPHTNSSIAPAAQEPGDWTESPDEDSSNEAADASDETADLANGIVGGQEVKPKEGLAHVVVGLVSQLDQGQALCTGTLIAENVVLTAAHCVDHNPESISVAFTTDFSKVKEADLRKVDRVVQHPRWLHHDDKDQGDLALVHFSGKKASKYHVAKILNEKIQLKVGQKIVLVGFGVTAGNDDDSAGILRRTVTEISSISSSTEVVSDGREHGVCFGDSGGPAFLKKGKQFYQWGVASSVSRKTCDDLMIHTDVRPYRQWIKDNVAKWQ